jgi:Spy/CpxP family protein refolding chaperone
MRRTLSASTFALAMAASTGAAFAEPPPEVGPPHGGCHHPRPMLMHVVHELDLSDAQKAQAKQLFEAERNTMRSQRDAMHSAHQAFNTATPGSDAFTAAEKTLEDAEANAARAHVQADADLRTKFYALLTDAQKAKLTTLLAQTPTEPPGSPQE